MISEELPLTPEEIARLIKASGRNQKAVAAELGIRPSTVSNWVNGVGSPSHENAARLRALKPLPKAVPDWTAYMADVKARIARNRNPPELPLVAVDPEPIAESVAARVGTPSQLADAVKAAIPTASQTADAVKAVIPTATEVADAVEAVVPTVPQVAEAVKSVVPTASEVADAVRAVVPTAPEVADAVRAVVPTAPHVANAVKAVVPTAQQVAAEVKATLAFATLVRTVRLSAALSVAVVVLGVGAMVALGCSTSVGDRLATVTDFLRTTLGISLDMSKKTGELWIPKEPFPGQKLGKDCNPRQGEVAINGGCWIQIGNMAPPCGEIFRHGDLCYRPVSADPAKPAATFPAVPGQ